MLVRIGMVAVVVLAAGHARAQQMNKEQWLQQTYQRSGMLLRAGTVCEKK